MVNSEANIRWVNDLLRTDPGITVEAALVAAQKTIRGRLSGPGFHAGSNIILHFMGSNDSSRLAKVTCGEAHDIIRERGLFSAMQASKAGITLDDPCAGDGGDPYDEPLPTERRASLAEAREIRGRAVPPHFFSGEAN